MNASAWWHRDRAHRRRARCGRIERVSRANAALRTTFLLPIILMYTAWSYWVFRGKVRGGGVGYH
jgi:hypothetical protein